MTRRCKWCIARIGSARVFADGEWRKWDGSISPFHNVPPPPFTDGICPECLEIELAKLDEPQTA